MVVLTCTSLAEQRAFATDQQEIPFHPSNIDLESFDHFLDLAFRNSPGKLEGLQILRNSIGGLETFWSDGRFHAREVESHLRILRTNGILAADGAQPNLEDSGELRLSEFVNFLNQALKTPPGPRVGSV